MFSYQIAPIKSAWPLLASMKMNHNDVYTRKDLQVVHTNFTTCGRGLKLTPFSYELTLLRYYLPPPPLSWPFFLNWPLVAIRSRAVVREGSEGAFGVSEKRTSFCLSLYHYQPPQILKPNDRSEKRGWTKKVLLLVFIEYVTAIFLSP